MKNTYFVKHKNRFYLETANYQFSMFICAGQIRLLGYDCYDKTYFPIVTIPFAEAEAKEIVQERIKTH